MSCALYLKLEAPSVVVIRRQMEVGVLADEVEAELSTLLIGSQIIEMCESVLY
jgi:hypothetical protein